MFTRKATLYFSLALVLLILGLFLDDFQIAILVLPLASLFFITNLWGLPEKVDLKLSRQVIPNETFGDEEIQVESQVQNNTRRPLVNIEIQESLPYKINPEKGTSRSWASAGPGEKLSLSLEFRSPGRGLYEIGPLTVRTRDPYGFYLTENKLEPEKLSVMPRPERMRGAQLRPRHIGPWPGNIPSKTLGVGTEFYSIREYLSGDDPKRINWKASARYSRLIVNETEAERVTDIMVVLDTDVSLFKDSQEELFETAVGAAASMSSLLLRQGNRVGLVLQGGERGSVPAGFGKRHERRILYLLAQSRPGRASVSTSYVVNLLARRILPSRSQVVIISSLLDPEIVEGARELAMAGYSMLVLSPVPSPPSRFASETEEIAYKIVMLERSNTLRALEKTSTVVQWSLGVPLSARLTKVKRLRPLVSN